MEQRPSKLIVPQVVNKFLAFCKKQPTTCLYHDPDRSSLAAPPSCFLKQYFNIIVTFVSTSSKWSIKLSPLS